MSTDPTAETTDALRLAESACAMLRDGLRVSYAPLVLSEAARALRAAADECDRAVSDLVV